MKKLILLSILALAALFVMPEKSNGQLPTPDRKGYMKSGTFVDFALSSKDTVSNYDTLYYLWVYLEEHQKTTQDVYVKLDSVSGSPTCTVHLEGLKFDDDSLSFVGIGDTITWSGVYSDTSIVISNTTANRYRILQLVIDATSTAQKFLVYDAQFKVWRE